MANSIKCIDNTSENVFFNGLPLVIGNVVSAWDDPGSESAIRNCLIITDSDVTGATLTANTIYNSCYECLVNNYTIVTFDSCDGLGITLQADISVFGEIPLTDSSYFIRANGRYDYVGCFSISTIEQVSLNDYNFVSPDFYEIEFLSTASFPDCGTCLNGFSAGTESQSCNLCWDGTGYTTSVISAPHPTWTNQYGQSINMLDSIVLGGPNGLNN